MSQLMKDGENKILITHTVSSRQLWPCRSASPCPQVAAKMSKRKSLRDRLKKSESWRRRWRSWSRHRDLSKPLRKVPGRKSGNWNPWESKSHHQMKETVKLQRRKYQWQARSRVKEGPEGQTSKNFRFWEGSSIWQSKRKKSRPWCKRNKSTFFWGPKIPK